MLASTVVELRRHRLLLRISLLLVAAVIAAFILIVVRA
jgi:hypothetical protein